MNDLVRRGAQVLVNLSNDSWLDAGDGGALEQHFSMAVFRAIETRRDLVRVAGSGASGFIDAFGRIGRDGAARHGGRAGRARSICATGLTPYVRWGDAWILLFGVAVVVVVGCVRRRGEPERVSRTRTATGRARGRRSLLGRAAGAIVDVQQHALDRRDVPGFLLMANRVVPSIALPEWEAARSTALFQHQVDRDRRHAVDDGRRGLSRSSRRSPPGTPHRYLHALRRPGAGRSSRRRARRFSGVEYGLLFGAYLSTGVAFFLTGLVVVWLKRSPASLGLLVQSPDDRASSS